MLTFDEYVSVLQDVGWYQAYSKDTHAAMREHLHAMWDNGPYVAVYALGRPAWDCAGPDGMEPTAIVEALARVSDAQFRPEGIQHNYFTEKGDTYVRVSFRHGTRHLETTALYLGGTFEPAIIALCNRALQESGSPYQFFVVPSADTYMYVACTTPSAFEQIKSRGFLTIREIPGHGWGAMGL